MFFITEKQENGFYKIALEHRENCIVEVVPDCGAMLHAMKIYKQDGCFDVIDSYADRTIFSDVEATGFKGVKLSPFPCRIKNATYQFEGVQYQLGSFAKGGDAIHGFLYNQAFTVVDKSVDDKKASVTLEHAYGASDAGYPFAYLCRVTYTLEKGNHLTITTAIINTGKTNLPVADGWHPYFTLGGKVDDLHLQFRADKMLEFDNLLPTGKVLENTTFKDGAQIGTAEIDNSFLLDFDEPQPMCILRNDDWQIEFYPDRTYPYLQIYIPPHRDSIAIENLSAPPDAFNNKMSLTVLLAGEEAVFTTGFAVKKR